jgi:hypothetical protein
VVPEKLLTKIAAAAAVARSFRGMSDLDGFVFDGSPAVGTSFPQDTSRP